MCKSHTKKIGALKLSQQDVGKNCIFRGCVKGGLFFSFDKFGGTNLWEYLRKKDEKKIKIKMKEKKKEEKK